MQKNLKVIIPIVLLLTVLLFCFVCQAMFHQNTVRPSEESAATDNLLTEPSRTGEYIDVSTESETIAPETDTTVCETEAMTDAEAVIKIDDQPPGLTNLLNQNSITYEILAADTCSQLITVVATGSSASIRFYSCTDGLWQELSHMSCSGHVGKSGVRSNKREGDGGTPSGFYSVGSAFYTKDAPQTALDAFQITSDTYWVDDPNSAFYNQRVEGTETKDWKSAEQMIRYDVYRYGFVVDYNTARTPGAGSAIFFHIGDHPTAGCIATSESMVLYYLAELDQAQNPHILIANN